VYVHIAPNNKMYFGITKLNVKLRWGSQGQGYNSQQLFWRAIQKYGWSNFKHIILLENLSEEVACECEIALISKFQTNNPEYGYNIYIGGNLGNTNIKLSDEQKQRLREANLGKHHSDETKRKMSISHTGYKQTPEHIENVRKAKIGRKLSEEHKKNLSISHMGHRLTETQKRKQSETLKHNIQQLTESERKKKYGRKYSNAVSVQLYINDVFEKEFKSSRDCASYLNLSPAMICCLISGKRKSDKYKILKVYKK